MARLQSSVLAIIREPKELAPERIRRNIHAIHPVEDLAGDQGRRGATPLCREACQLVLVARLRGWLVFATRTETIFPRKEPSGNTIFRMPAVRANAHHPAIVFPAMARLQSRPCSSLLDPIVRIFFYISSKRQRAVSIRYEKAV